jgi:hypothetical protein
VDLHRHRVDERFERVVRVRQGGQFMRHFQGPPYSDQCDGVGI